MGTLANSRGAAVSSVLFLLLACLFYLATPPVHAQTVNTGDVIISELRFRGPTFDAAQGIDGSLDEYIELYNNTDSPITVAATDGSPGWSLGVFYPGSSFEFNVLRYIVIPNGTVIPARGHFLLATAPPEPTDDNPTPVNNSYSLSAYAAGDLLYNLDIPDDAGVTLFNTADAAHFTADNYLDAVGFNESNAKSPNSGLFREGTPLQSPGANDGQYAFVRRLESGVPQDTDDNASDFVFVSTDGGNYGGVQSILGAPGPENTASPIQHNAQITVSLVDPSVSSSSSPNRERAYASGPNAGNGVLFIRRTYTNNTGATITSLRFRVSNITTLNSPNTCGGCQQADMRVLTSGASSTSSSDGETIIGLEGAALEQPSAQPLGGGLNSSLTVNLPGGRLLPGESVNVEFLLGVQQSGSFRFYVNAEAQLSTRARR